ncbi:MAG: Cna B-type domain-containing protein [Candidatus Scatomorpha sp.]|jgi:hypothetical protein
MKKNLLVFLIALLMFLALLAPTPALAANVSVEFSIIDQNGVNIAGLSGDVSLNRTKDGGQTNVATWPANSLPRTESLEVNGATGDYYWFRLKEINPGYAHPGIVRFRVQADGTIIKFSIDGEIFQKNKVWLRAYRTDDTATLHVRDIDNPGVDISGVKMRFISGTGDDAGCEPDIFYFDSASGGMKVWLWPQGLNTNWCHNMLDITNVATIPAGYEVYDTCLNSSSQPSSIVFRRESDGGSYRVDVKYPKDSEFSANPNGTEMVFWIKNSTAADVNVRAMNKEGNALADVPLHLLRYNGTDFVAYPDYPDDHTSTIANPWALKLRPGRYKVIEGSTPLPDPYMWKEDAQIKVADDGSVTFVNIETLLWEPVAAGESVPLKLDRGAHVSFKKVDENENLFLTETQPGYDAEKTAEFKLYMYNPGAGAWFTLDKWKHNTKDQNPWEYHLKAGDYYLKEIKAPQDYKAVEDYYFRVKEDGANFTIVPLTGGVEGAPITEIKIKNEPKAKYNIPIKKTDENNNLFIEEGKPGYDAKKTAEFELLRWKADAANWFAVPGTNHNTKDLNPWSYNLFPGDYKLTETKVPEGYYSAIDYTFRVKEDGKISSLIGFTEQEEITEIKVENERIPVYPIRFSVLDKAGFEETTGVKVDLNKGNGDYIDGWTTDGNIKTIELPEAEYGFAYVIGGGYVQGVWLKFRVNSEGKVDIYNPKTSTWTPRGDNLVQLILEKGVKVIFRKVDAENPAAELAGASLWLEEVTTPPGTGFSYGWESGVPKEFFLKKGASYKYVEKTPPDGYWFLDGFVNFRIAPDGTIYVRDVDFGKEHISLSNTVVLENKKNESGLASALLYLNARDKTGTPANLPWAELGLQRKVGSAFVTLPWQSYVSDTYPRSLYLPFGTYRLFSIAPPDGYVDDTGFTEFVVSNTGVTTSDPELSGPFGSFTMVHINFIKADPNTTNIKVNKVWNDNNNQDGLRPESITVELLADGASTGKQLVLKEANLWRGSFQNVPDDGKTYTLKEVSGPGYSTEITGNASDGFTITNTHTPSKININVTELWNDKDNQDGKRPASVRVRLLADGAATGKWMDITKAGGWKGSFTGVDEYKGGKKIVYTIEQDPIGEGYASVITGKAASGFVVTNTRAPSKIDIEVTKLWKDSDNKALKRPDSVTLRLYANGKDSGIKLEITKAGGWKGTFTGLDEYKDGKKIVYTVRENPVQYYKYAVKGDAAKGFTVTNTYRPYVNVYVPKMGDASNLQLYAGICLLAAAGLASLMLWKYLEKERAKSVESEESVENEEGE